MLIKRKNLEIAGLFLLLIFVASCKKDSSSPVVFDAAKQQDVANVAYGTDAAQKMDIYLPAGRSTTATNIMILVHGGSWESGDKADFNDAVANLRAALPGYAFFNINYRLAANGKNTYPAAVDDVTAALNFINGKSSDYAVNTQKIVLSGASAGAYLAMMEAYKNNSPNIKAVIDLFGPVDLTWLYFNHPFVQLSQPILKNFIGVGADQDANLYIQASPITYVSASSPPTEIFQGRLDDVVLYDESVRLQAKLQSLGVINEFTVYDSEGHGWTGANLVDTYNKIAVFVKNNVK